MFKVGTKIEFHSNEHDGCWKPGIVVPYCSSFSYNCRRHIHNPRTCDHVRIRTGNSVYIIRPYKKCRRVI